MRSWLKNGRAKGVNVCGIAGIFGSGAEQQNQLEGMLAAVRSRGEVDETFFSEGFCVATRRLKIVDRERAVQPIFNETGDKFIIFNGEIFNYKEIKRELETSHQFKTNSDTETILHAFEEYGEGCLEHFDGQFAFVIYDLASQSLFAARDHLGIVPLYFVRTDESLYIASIVKALTFLDRPIQALLPGHTLDINGSLKQYYRPHYGSAGLNKEVFVGQLKEALQAAVAKRLDTDLPVGVIYSGGIDSSIVLSEACKRHQDVTAFTIGSLGSEDFEISRRFCQERDIQQVIIPLEGRDIRSETIRRAINVTELNEYLDIINAVISLPLFARIHQEGIRVVLSGDGSDELFAGYHMYSHVSLEDESKLFLHNLMSLHRTELQRVDRCSMAFEVEVRVPFLDMQLVELALQMPIVWKVNDGIEKWVVREAFKGELPEYILRREKSPLSYSSGLHEWVRMQKISFASYYNEFGFDLHAPIKMDFSYILARNNYDFAAAVAEDELAKDYPKLELVKEALKARARKYLAGVG
jgi:asparagine synthase (glutamine-hydrolysing)